MKILANGEIVPDDDPRAQSTSQVPKKKTTSETRQTINTTSDNDVVAHGPPTVTIFDTLNNQLVSLGVPTWSLGPYVVRPIVSAGFLLSLVLMGFRGLLFSGLLFFVVNYSQSRGPRLPFPDLSRFGFGSGRQSNGNETSRDHTINTLHSNPTDMPPTTSGRTDRKKVSDKKYFTGQGNKLS